MPQITRCGTPRRVLEVSGDLDSRISTRTPFPRGAKESPATKSVCPQVRIVLCARTSVASKCGGGGWCHLHLPDIPPRYPPTHPLSHSGSASGEGHHHPTLSKTAHGPRPGGCTGQSSLIATTAMQGLRVKSRCGLQRSPHLEWKKM